MQKSPLMVPGREACGFVSPNIFLPILTTSIPSQTWNYKVFQNDKINGLCQLAMLTYFHTQPHLIYFIITTTTKTRDPWWILAPTLGQSYVGIKLEGQFKKFQWIQSLWFFYVLKMQIFCTTRTQGQSVYKIWKQSIKLLMRNSIKTLKFVVHNSRWPPDGHLGFQIWTSVNCNGMPLWCPPNEKVMISTV